MRPNKPPAPQGCAPHDPGGKVRLTLPPDVTSYAVFGGDSGEYRYRLTRTWDGTKPYVLFVLMNPSIADPTVDDPTVAKCARYARAWNFGGIHVGNTFAYRCTDQKRLLTVPDPIGPENDTHILAMAREAALVVFAYGQPGHASLRPRGIALARRIIAETGAHPHVFRLSKSGTPYHPLYLKESLRPLPWELPPCAT